MVQISDRSKEETTELATTQRKILIQYARHGHPHLSKTLSSHILQISTEIQEMIHEEYDNLGDMLQTKGAELQVQ